MVVGGGGWLRERELGMSQNYACYAMVVKIVGAQANRIHSVHIALIPVVLKLYQGLAM